MLAFKQQHTGHDQHSNNRLNIDWMVIMRSDIATELILPTSSISVSSNSNNFFVLILRFLASSAPHHVLSLFPLLPFFSSLHCMSSSLSAFSYSCPPPLLFPPACPLFLTSASPLQPPWMLQPCLQSLSRCRLRAWAATSSLWSERRMNTAGPSLSLRPDDFLLLLLLLSSRFPLSLSLLL